MTFCFGSTCSPLFLVETLFQSDHFLFRFPGKSFDITYIRIVFFSPRPESFAIYKRQTSNGPWLPYQYYRCVYLIDSTVFRRFLLIFFLSNSKTIWWKTVSAELVNSFPTSARILCLIKWMTVVKFMLIAVLIFIWYSRYIHTTRTGVWLNFGISIE